tara:strand:- start:2160 stop:2522 length:363 start_codon:yes stop_codon:yes gene_type:complete
MVRPGMKRLREAQNVKVQPNKTGTSFMLGQSVNYRKGTSCLVDGTCNQDGILLKKGVVFNSNGNTPYNDLANNMVWAPNPADIERAKSDDRCCNQIKQKEFPRNVATGNIVPKSWNFSWQ